MTLKQLLTEAKNLNIQEQMQLATQLLQWVEVKINKEPQCQKKDSDYPDSTEVHVYLLMTLTTHYPMSFGWVNYEIIIRYSRFYVVA